ncbi:Uu.00g096420.m01.CDS01 [Anthostomella pinea]|uniref:Uu.00g096420.m01.CDS01 n=1 Tax=Anthostomella pinea TaxID=933095 RepID=A0AAI8YF28_9PEZI|nr:Uu.00g096420.m01.CDS01 [Anthostomella pinea]
MSSNPNLTVWNADVQAPHRQSQRLLTKEPLPGTDTRRVDGRMDGTLEEFLTCEPWEAKQRVQRLISLAEGIDNRLPGEIKQALQREQEKLDELNKDYDQGNYQRGSINRKNPTALVAIIYSA